jgi:hypothetical protein
VLEPGSYDLAGCLFVQASHGIGTEKDCIRYLIDDWGRKKEERKTDRERAGDKQTLSLLNF